ncbi:MAG: hypothetical protein P1V20_29905 [Verrucomicrobiales bacterium]|nr:hypothetical protein [Verrucomicrobiales bacterium]
MKKNFRGQLEEWKLESNGTYRYMPVTGIQAMELVSRDNFNKKERERKLIISRIEDLKNDLAKARARELFESA